ncbi:hypothetical protein H2200_010919 [Cladophialophora chaetospira]|uniref:Uncharacterized protein n=1 Tax=Cladophialophora chaetospira TaxID=386627 RepID=A0AA39CE19_9EURO|nr:hypothetical protein H2200_010919 [Cladophialophora chaetospira]
MANPITDSSGIREKLSASLIWAMRLDDKLYGGWSCLSLIDEHDALIEENVDLLKHLSRHPSLELPEVLASGFEIDLDVHVDACEQAEAQQWIRESTIYEADRASMNVRRALYNDSSPEDTELEAVLQKNESAQRNIAKLVDEMRARMPLLRVEVPRLRSLKAKLDIIQCCLGPKEQTVPDENKSQSEERGDEEVDGATADTA